jgi:Uma2 family endonuclease
MSSVAQRLMTAEEYLQSPVNTKQSELVHGRVVETAIQGARHGGIVATVSAILYGWAQSTASGCVCAKAGYVLTYDPDTVLGPDISYVRADRISAEGVPKGFWPGAPDLAVEVLSPDDKEYELRRRLRYFLDAGTPLVWTVYPDTREVIAHTPDGLAKTYGEDDILEHQDVLPGFSCKVAELFV